MTKRPTTRIREDETNRVKDIRPQQRAAASNKAKNPGLYPSTGGTSGSGQGRAPVPSPRRSPTPGSSKLDYTPTSGGGGYWAVKKPGKRPRIVGTSKSEDGGIKPLGPPSKRKPTAR